MTAALHSVRPTDAVAVPAPRTSGEPATPARRERPPAEYWDVLQARWRTAG
jgi:hypothetical protein